MKKIKLVSLLHFSSSPKQLIKTFFICSIFICTVFAQSSVTVSVNMGNSIRTLYKNFLGLSFGTDAMFPGYQGSGYMFDTTDTQMINLFNELGIRNLRLGGSPVDYQPAPTHADVDALFRFVNALNLNVIYSFKLKNAVATDDASLAKYIWDNYNQHIFYYAVGNEPDLYESSYSTFLSDWRNIVTTVLDSVPSAAFGGPDLAGTSWYSNFSSDEKNSGYLKSVFSHYYVNDGGNSTGRSASTLASDMLSSSWVDTKYPSRYNKTDAVSSSDGLDSRFTETNSYTGTGPTNIYASSLFALDYIYWWAKNGGGHFKGIDFHCNMDRLNTAIYYDSNDQGYHAYPLAYGIKAYSLGGHGSLLTTNITNTNGLNIRAYATGNSDSLYVTFINKENGSGAQDANVTISASGLPSNVAVMTLDCINGDITSTSGVKLNGATIPNSGSFKGKWTLLSTNVSGSYTVLVPKSSAAILRFSSQIPDPPPSTPSLSSPSNGAVDVMPVLSWSSSSGATRYHLQLSTNSSFDVLAVDTIITGTSINLTNELTIGKQLESYLKYGQKYYWRVSALGSTYGSSFSSSRSFTIFDLPGYATSYKGPIIKNGTGTLEIFGIGSDNSGNVWHRWQNKNDLPNHGVSYWVSWHALQGGLEASNIAVARNLNYTLQIFVDTLGHNGPVYYKKAPSGQWGVWTSMGGTGYRNLQVTYNYDGSLHLFALDAYGNIYENSMIGANSDNWTGWSQITGHCFREDYAVAPTATGRIVLAGCDTSSSHHIFVKIQNASGGNSWGSWNDLGNINGTGTKRRLRFGRNADGRLELFGQSSNGHVWHSYQIAGAWENSWSSWSDLGKSLKNDFVAITEKSGREVVLGVSSSSPYHVFNLWQSSDNSTGWGTTWTDMGCPSGVTLQGNLMAGICSDDNIQIFGMGSDGNVWSSWQKSGWTSWGSGGNFGGSSINWEMTSYGRSFQYKKIISDQNPKEFKLFENYPNPFNPSTMINFELPKNMLVNITVYNMLGEKVAVVLNRNIDKDFHQVNFNASSLPSGVYLYKIKAGRYSAAGKMLLLK